uniref:Uncharacterized protein n=1 Tax=Oryza glumipatula TaxID=40148 RepID=A0A0D9ZGH5_9ORYZ
MNDGFKIITATVAWGPPVQTLRDHIQQANRKREYITISNDMQLVRGFLGTLVAYHLEGVGGFTNNEVGDVADDVGCEAHVEEHEGYAEQHLADVGGMQVSVADSGKRGDGPLNAIHREMQAAKCSANSVTCIHMQKDYKLKIGDVHSLHSWFTFIPPYTRALPPCDRSN